MELEAGLEHPTKIFQDNFGAIKWTKEMTGARHVKHIALKYSHVGESVESHEIEVLYVPSAENKPIISPEHYPASRQHREYLKISDVNLRGRVGKDSSD